MGMCVCVEDVNKPQAEMEIPGGTQTEKQRKRKRQRQIKWKCEKNDSRERASRDDVTAVSTEPEHTEQVCPRQLTF